MSPCDEMALFSGLNVSAHGCGIVYLFEGGVESYVSVISSTTLSVLSHAAVAKYHSRGSFEGWCSCTTIFGRR